MGILCKSASGLPFLFTWKKHLSSEAVFVLKYLSATCQQCVLSYLLGIWAHTYRKISIWKIQQIDLISSMSGGIYGLKKQYY